MSKMLDGMRIETVSTIVPGRTAIHFSLRFNTEADGETGNGTGENSAIDSANKEMVRKVRAWLEKYDAL